MSYVDEAKRLRPLIVESSKYLPDSEAYYAPELFPVWKTATAYAVNDRIQYGVKLYKCVQAHTSQDDWTPDVTPALWIVVSVEEWPEWVQPTGAHDAYNTGDRVSHINKHWECTIDNNVYEPGVYGWNEV
jgi:hypothetical protein